jgi:hypothetical protein
MRRVVMTEKVINRLIGGLHMAVFHVMKSWIIDNARDGYVLMKKAKHGSGEFMRLTRYCEKRD